METLDKTNMEDQLGASLLKSVQQENCKNNYKHLLLKSMQIEGFNEDELDKVGEVVERIEAHDVDTQTITELFDKLILDVKTRKEKSSTQNGGIDGAGGIIDGADGSNSNDEEDGEEDDEEKSLQQKLEDERAAHKNTQLELQTLKQKGKGKNGNAKGKQTKAEKALAQQKVLKKKATKIVANAARVLVKLFPDGVETGVTKAKEDFVSYSRYDFDASGLSGNTLVLALQSNFNVVTGISNFSVPAAYRTACCLVEFRKEIEGTWPEVHAALKECGVKIGLSTAKRYIQFKDQLEQSDAVNFIYGVGKTNWVDIRALLSYSVLKDALCCFMNDNKTKTLGNCFRVSKDGDEGMVRV